MSEHNFMEEYIGHFLMCMNSTLHVQTAVVENMEQRSFVHTCGSVETASRKRRLWFIQSITISVFKGYHELWEALE